MASAAPWWLKLKSWILSPLSLPVKAPCLSIREPRDLFLFVCLGALTLPSALCKSVLNLSVKRCTPPVCCSAAELWPSCREREIKTDVVNNRRENKNRPEGQQGKWKLRQLFRVTTQIKNLPGTCSLRFLRLHDCQQRPLLSRDQVKTRSIWSPFPTTGTFSQKLFRSSPTSLTLSWRTRVSILIPFHPKCALVAEMCLKNCIKLWRVCFTEHHWFCDSESPFGADRQKLRRCINPDSGGTRTINLWVTSPVFN